MDRIKRLRPSPAMIVAVAALVVALGGTSYAALLVTGKSVKNGTLTGKDVKNSSLTAGDVRNRSLKAEDFESSALLRGPQGPQGSAGIAGTAGRQRRPRRSRPQGPPGATNVVVREGTTVTVQPDTVASAMASCGTGERATGGGGGATAAGMNLIDSYPIPLAEGATPTGWEVGYRNTTMIPRSVNAFVVCFAP